MKDSRKEGAMVQETASLHEKAVQAIARGEVDPTPTPKKKRAQIASPGLDKHIKVLPPVWTKAQEILAGQHGFTRIEVIDETTVVVR
jgi:hypothetical protein